MINLDDTATYPGSTTTLGVVQSGGVGVANQYLGVQDLTNADQCSWTVYSACKAPSVTVAATTSDISNDLQFSGVEYIQTLSTMAAGTQNFP